MLSVLWVVDSNCDIEDTVRRIVEAASFVGTGLLAVELGLFRFEIRLGTAG